MNKKEKIVLIGAGGHGREVVEILQSQRQSGRDSEALGFVDDSPQLRGKTVAGIPVLGNMHWFEDADPTQIMVLCTLGSPNDIRSIADKVLRLGFSFISAVSPNSLISETVVVGQGVTIFPNAVINTSTKIGDHCIINLGVTISHDSNIGKYSNINPGVHVAGNVEIHEGCYIGMGANIIQGCKIGSWSIIGAGAVIIDDIPSNVTVVGCPGRIIKRR